MVGSSQQQAETSYGTVESNTGGGFGGEYLNDPEKKRKLIIVVASAIVVIVLIVVILSLVFTLGGPSCKTVDNRPNSDLSSIRPIASQDEQVLVRFAGYLELSIENPGDFDDTRFLELNLRRVRHSIQADTGRIHIRLDTDCATVDILAKKNYSSSNYELQKAFITSKSSNVDFDTCEAPFSAIFNLDQYYRCHSTKLYYCSTVSNALFKDDRGYGRKIKQIGLEVDMLDLEIDGDPVSIESGHFDKDPKYC